MKCELCSSVDRVAGQRLCPPCVEAIARLWTIANQNSQPMASSEGCVGAESRVTFASFTAYRSPLRVRQWRGANALIRRSSSGAQPPFAIGDSELGMSGVWRAHRGPFKGIPMSWSMWNGLAIGLGERIRQAK